ncbi:MAG: AmmeMemoRadiSam system radical SAM enzyme [Candidatus Bipolaricaulota bacterium]|nr:AmmeMemoRadiSam system radical SAM enzyme [Candidatus Bipolaricaulota bacterium]
MPRAILWERIGEERVRCALCPHRCLIPPGGRGVCGVRENREGTLYALTHGRLVSQALDPIEKKPLYHFLPGSLALSVAAVGCNLRCDFCQNHVISQYPREHPGAVPGERVPPEAVVRAAEEAGAPAIAYTYTEPTVFFETCLEIGKLARARGIRNVFVTNGYMTAEALGEAQGWLDGANVDLKAFSDDFYRRYCGGSLQPVLDTIGRMVEAGIWVEVTTLVIPGRNDSEEELRWIAQFLAGLSPDLPWHVSRFVPAYKVQDRPPTPVATLRRAREIGREAGLRYVYLGNVPGEGEDTACPSCGRVVLRRYGFRVLENALVDGRCPGCGEAIAGVWS